MSLRSCQGRIYVFSFDTLLQNYYVCVFISVIAQPVESRPTDFMCSVIALFLCLLSISDWLLVGRSIERRIGLHDCFFNLALHVLFF